MWVLFTKTFRWCPKSNVSIRYDAGMRMRVTRRCAHAALAKGAVVRIDNPKLGGGHGARRDDHGAGEASAEA